MTRNNQARKKHTDSLTTLSLALAWASSTCFAQGDAMMLEEVIVTAQKRAENLQDIAATINAVSARQIEEFSILEFEDLSTLVAGLDLQKQDARRQTLTIRGITADPDNVAKQPISSYLNRVPVRQQVIFTAVYDIERIEVLRGPQGTLQGRTDPAGALLSYTQRPDLHQYNGYFQQTFTDQPGSNSQFAAGTPLVKDRWAIRAAGVYDDNQGQQYENINNGQDESQRTRSLRLSSNALLTDNLEWFITYSYTDRYFVFPEAIYGDKGGYSAISNPLSPVVSDPAYPDALDKEDRKAIAQGRNADESRVNLVTSQFDWDLGPGTLTWIAGFYDMDQESGLDRDISNVYPLPEAQTTKTDYRYHSQEVLWASNEGAFGGVWDYIVGGFWEQATSDTTNLLDVTGQTVLRGLIPPTSGAGTALSTVTAPVDRMNASIFNHNTFHFTDTLSLQLGWRYQKAWLDTRADLAVQFDGDTVLEQCLIPDGTDCSPTQADLTTDQDEAVTGTIKLAWFVVDQTLLYGSIDTSYRPPGVTITPTPLSVDNLLFDNETGTAFELGFKSTFADGRVRLNGSWFYQKFAGFQARATSANATFYESGTAQTQEIAGGITFNADATVQGAELELQSLLTDTWTLNAGGAYVDSRFDDGATGPCNRPLNPAEEAAQVEVAQCDIGGELISAQPLFSANMSSEYYLPVGELQWYLRGLLDYRSSSSFYLVEGQTIDPYATLSLWTGFRSASATWDANVWVKNLTDEQQLAVLSNRQFVDAGSVSAVSNWRRGTMIQPRTVGLTLRYNW